MDVESAIIRLVRDVLVQAKFRLPIQVATVAANGACLFTRMTAPPPNAPKGSATLEHITGEVDDDGFEAPIHFMLTDATMRVRVAVARGGAAPVLMEPLQEPGPG